ncbi:DUF2298 domain-containing protein [Haloprofundus salilacus]|uniref:DUF2298 domain-containing protein n=1 Tax=Haloprofundus salilacus TaxID=2876190 RepID=UPI001CCA6C42|nr:DUF2298 domain-containing protein [Haloprofundus salilacus]
MNAALLSLRWLLLLLLLGLVSLPISRRLFPRTPDRGASFGFTVSLTVFGLVAFWVGHVSLWPWGLVAAVVSLVALSVLTRRFLPAPERPVDWRRCAEVAGVFGLAFGFMLFLRALDPGIVPAGGEKFLDFGLLKALLRTDALPPEDIWFAGESIRYYYGSYLLTALLTRLTATPPNVAYNVGLAGFYATLVVTAYGLTGALADARGRSARLGGAVGAFLTAFAGNLATPIRVSTALLPREFVARYGHILFGGIRAPYEDVVTQYQSPTEFTHWYGRYVIPNTPDVFPMWTYVNGDFRAHMVGASFLLLFVALCFAYFRTPKVERRRRRALAFVAMPAVAAIVGLISTWALPTTVGLAALALLFADASSLSLLPRVLVARVERSKSAANWPFREGGRTALATGLGVSVGIVGAVLIAPALLRSPSNEGLGFLPPRSGLGGLLLVHGAFLGIFALFLAPRVREALPSVSRRTVVTVGAVGIVAFAGLVAADLAAVALFVPPLFVGWYLLRGRNAGGYETVLMIAGLGIVLAVEFVYADVWPYSPGAPRWNTVYKAYMQVWLFWGVAAGAMVAEILGRARERVVTGRSLSVGPNADKVAAVLAVVLVVLAGTFGALSSLDRIDRAAGDDPTHLGLSLDGTAYVETYHPHEAQAIDWLDEREGTPTMVSRPAPGTYQWYNAPSAMTGVPTVAGWEHVAGYHGREAYGSRVTAVNAIYESEWIDSKWLLQQYEVEYIYYGPVEREAYGERDFSQYEGVSVAYENEGVTIYEVDQSAWDDSEE